jgi:hypothetical protein
MILLRVKTPHSQELYLLCKRDGIAFIDIAEKK